MSAFPDSAPEAETHLVKRLYARDESAMTDFYDRYGTTLYRVIYTFVGDAAAAEDVLQESLVKIWHGFARYCPERGRLYTWTVNICRHQAIDYLRHEQARGTGRTCDWEQAPAVERMSASAGFVPEHLGVHESLRVLEPALQRVLELRYFEGWTQEEVAQHLDLPLGTVKTRQRRALKQLAVLWHA